MAETPVPADVAMGLINLVTDKATAEDRAVAYEHISQLVYTERARLVAYLASVYPSRIGPDTADPTSSWYVVTIETPFGQMSWHISDEDRLDRHLFDHVRPTLPGDPPWDGHTTEQKYERLEQLVALNDAGVTELERQERSERFEIEAVRAVLNSPRAHGVVNASDPDGNVERVVFVKDIEAALGGYTPPGFQP